MAKKPSPITSAVQPAATLVIDDHAYQLVYDYNAIAEAESATGNTVNLLHGISAMLNNTMTAAQLRGLFYAALLPRQPSMTLADAGTLLRIDTMPAIMQALADAWTLSMPEAKKSDPLVMAVAAPDGV